LTWFDWGFLGFDWDLGDLIGDFLDLGEFGDFD
jgi:hypothetical protein